MSQRKPRRKSKNRRNSKKQTKQEPILIIETHLKRRIPIFFKRLKDASGYCYNPDGKTPKILIEKNLLPRRMLNVIIEEVTHAFFYDLPEYKVRKFSAQLGRVIYSLFLKK
jgi:hypothetical protein